jgi:ADP-heptose:LPS heptosyltransferase
MRIATRTPRRVGRSDPFSSSSRPLWRENLQRGQFQLVGGAIRKAAVFRALKLGDLLVAVPALRSLRAGLPDAEIHFVGLPWAREFVDRFPHLLDGFREFPGWPGLPETEARLDRIPAFLSNLQNERYDLVVQLHGSGSIVNELCTLFGGRRTAGFSSPGAYCPDPASFLPWPHGGLELHRLLALTEFLGFPTCGEHLEFPVRNREFERVLQAIDVAPWKYACIHVGASVRARRWPESRFAAVADALADHGLQIVLTGTAAEAPLTRAVAASMTAPVIDFAGKTDLGTAAALIARARILVCNDTGVSHLADAVRTPSVVISTGDNPNRWAPIDAARHRVLTRAGGLVSTREAVAAALELLQRITPVLRLFPLEGIPCGRSAS